MGASVDTVAHCLEACEQAYLLFGCPHFSYSERQSAHRNKKYYPIDTALHRAVSGTGGRDRGKALETFVFLSLRRRALPVGYWRDGSEVDFVVRSGKSVIPVQVSWEGEQERHKLALRQFYERHPHALDPIFVEATNAPFFATEVDRIEAAMLPA